MLIDQAVTVEGLTLLYIGISPKAPPLNGRSPSRQNLRTRIRYHMQGNAEGSTLRLTLGCLLGLQLRRVGSGRRLTFGVDEQRLSDWLAANARVTWEVCYQPWLLEPELIISIPLPLNLEGNSHPFCHSLAEIRRSARRVARNLPICP